MTNMGAQRDQSAANTTQAPRRETRVIGRCWRNCRVTGPLEPGFSLVRRSDSMSPTKPITKGRNMPKRANPGSTKACPANCIGGYADNQRSLYSGQKECMPTDILEMAKSGLQYCIHCHAVWEDREGNKKLHGFLENGRFYRHKMTLG